LVVIHANAARVASARGSDARMTADGASPASAAAACGPAILAALVAQYAAKVRTSARMRAGPQLVQRGGPQPAASEFGRDRGCTQGPRGRRVQESLVERVWARLVQQKPIQQSRSSEAGFSEAGFSEAGFSEAALSKT
jgi:hypothetical protein